MRNSMLLYKETIYTKTLTVATKNTAFTSPATALPAPVRWNPETKESFVVLYALFLVNQDRSLYLCISDIGSRELTPVIIFGQLGRIGVQQDIITEKACSRAGRKPVDIFVGVEVMLVISRSWLPVGREVKFEDER